MKDKKDPWKAMIDDNLEEHNQREPRDLWGSIESELDQSIERKPKTIELWKVYRAAAVLVVVLGVGFFALFNNGSPQSAVADLQSTEEVKPYYSEELLEVENFYASEIEDKLNQVKKLTDDGVAIHEIQLLKEEFDQLKSEVGDNVNDGEVIEAMIMNYKIRLDLLKEILNDLQKDDDSSNKKTSYEAI